MNFMKEFVEIRHKEMSLTIFPEVAERLGLRNRQYVDNATFHQALRLNCEMGIAICELNIAINEQNKAAETEVL